MPWEHFLKDKKEAQRGRFELPRVAPPVFETGAVSQAKLPLHE
jgi:hypothetical protein